MGGGNEPADWPTLDPGAFCPDCGPLRDAWDQECAVEDAKERDERAVAEKLGLARWGHRPEGPHPVIAGLAWGVNALTNPEDRDGLLELADAVRATTEDTTRSETDRWGLTVGLATWCAAQVLPLATTAERVACEEQIVAAQAWANCPCEQHAAGVARAEVPYSRDATAAAEVASTLTHTIRAVTSTEKAPVAGWGHDLLVIDVDPANTARDVDEWSDVTPGGAAAVAAGLAYEVGLASARATTGAAARLGLLAGLLGEHARLARAGSGSTNREEKS
ncbi:MAG: hypothetical protein L0H96_25070 [Humibacillus sp.]|nr:hypothetical protein [Humibacillus sp.]MDN5780154.1 hypothetical protein [Humibacillus sp.]